MNGTRAPTGPDTTTARPWHHVEAKPFGPEHILPLLAPCAEGAHALALVTAFARFEQPLLYAVKPGVAPAALPREGAIGWLTTFTVDAAPADSLEEHPLFRAFQAPQPIAVDEEPAVALGHLMARLSAETADRWDGWEAVSAALLQLILVETSRAAPGRGAAGSKLVSLLERRRQRRPRSS
ncbi:MAG: hypothetical protein ABW060_00825 [Solirubrobacteraceae bacterium]